MESWRKVFRDGVEPLVSAEGLLALRDALAGDDQRLVQGVTTVPPLSVCQDSPVEACCPLAYTGWVGDGLKTVGEAEEYFARMSYAADQRLGEPSAIRFWLNWVDETPRDEMRREMLAEVNRALAARAVAGLVTA